MATLLANSPPNNTCRDALRVMWDKAHTPLALSAGVVRRLEKPPSGPPAWLSPHGVAAGLGEGRQGRGEDGVARRRGAVVPIRRLADPGRRFPSCRIGASRRSAHPPRRRDPGDRLSPTPSRNQSGTASLIVLSLLEADPDRSSLLLSISSFPQRASACTCTRSTYLICTYLHVTHVYPIVRPRNDTCLPDSPAETMTHVYPMENSWIHSFLWKTPPAALRGPRSRERARPARHAHPEAEHPSRGKPRGALAYSPMRRSCAGAMRGDEGEITSPPVTVP